MVASINRHRPNPATLASSCVPRVPPVAASVASSTLCTSISSIIFCSGSSPSPSVQHVPVVLIRNISHHHISSVVFVFDCSLSSLVLDNVSCATVIHTVRSFAISSRSFWRFLSTLLHVLCHALVASCNLLMVTLIAAISLCLLPPHTSDVIVIA